MRCCLIITTYERPDALARVLQSVAQQSRAPDEIIIADDGSGAAVCDLIEAFAQRSTVPVRGVHQEHAGFRAGLVRNLAIAQSTADYIVLIDGDMILHPQFVADHVRAARQGYWTQGVRILLDDAASRRVLSSGCAPRPWQSGLGVRRRVYAMRMPGLARPIARAANALVAIKACNQGFWRSDLLQANGYDEDLTGWGSEDKELCARLRNGGVRRQTLLFAGIAWHLAHKPASRAAARANRERWQETVRTGRLRCIRGIDQHLPR